MRSFSPSLLSMFEATSYFETNIAINTNVDINNLLEKKEGSHDN
jgi:hypothetical protein